MAGGGGSANNFGGGGNGGTGYAGQAGGNGTKSATPFGYFYGGGGGGAAGGGAGGAGAGGAAGGAGATGSQRDGQAGHDASSTSGGGGGGGGGGLSGLLFNGSNELQGTYRGGNGGAGGRGSSTNGFGGGGGGGAGGYGVIFNGAYLANTGGIFGGNGGAGGISSNTNGGYGGDGGVGLFEKGSASLFINNASASIVGGNGGTDNRTGNAITTAKGGAGVVFNHGGTISNSGLIQGGNGYSSSGGAGITGANLSVTNAGTIAGGFQYSNGTGNQASAVAFTGGVNRFTMAAGSSLSGTVDAFSKRDTFALGGDADSTFDLAQIGDAGSNAEFRGFGTLAKSGSSTWTLSGTPTASSALAYRLEAGTLDLGGTTQTVTGLTMSTGTLTGGELDTSGVFRVASGTIATLLGGTGAFAKSTAGIVFLTNDNTYSGGTTISAGTVSISTFNQGNYTGVGTGAVLLSGGTLELAASASLANEVNVAAGKTGTIGAAAGTTNYLNYVVTNTGSSTISVGAGATLALGSAVDTGTIVFQTVANSVDRTASILIGGGTVEDTLGYLGSDFLSVAAKTTIAANATLKLDDNSDEIANLQGTAASATIDTGTQSGTVLTIDAGSYAGTISGSGSLTKATAGRLILAGANTYGGSTTVKAGTLSLAHASNGTIDAAGGTSYIAVQDGTTLEIAVSGTLSNDIEFVSGTGTIGAAAGTTVNFDGLFGNDGASTIVFGSATDTGTIVFASNAFGTVNGGAGTIEIGGGTLRDGGALGFILSAPFSNTTTVQIDAGATLDLNGNNDAIDNLTGLGTLTNAAGASTTIDGGTFGGVIAGAADVAFEGDTTLSGISTNTGGTFVDAGVTLTLATGGSTSAGSAIFDDGTIMLSGGTLAGTSLQETQAGGLVTGTGTISASISGALDFTSLGGALTFTGTNVFGGTLSGTAATFARGTDTFGSGSSFSSLSSFGVSGAKVNITAGRNYAGAFHLDAGTLNLGRVNLNLTGATRLGGGTIAGQGNLGAYGATTLTRGTVVTGSSTLVVGGTLTAAGGLSLQTEADLAVTSSGTYRLNGDISIGARTAGDTIVNQGLIAKTGGTGKSSITAAVTNTGTLQVARGTLNLTNAISGSGTLSIEGNSAMELGALIASQQKVQFGTGNGHLNLDDASTFHAAIAGFGAGDVIALKDFDATAKLAYTASTGTLRVSDSAHTFSAHLDGSYNASGFSLAHAATGGVIRYTA